jgi:membrane dipeptidase
VRYQGFGVVVPFFVRGAARWRHALGTLRLMHETFRGAPGQVALARTAAEGEQIVAGGRLAAFIGLEGCHALDGQPERINTLRDHGVSYVGLCHFDSNDVVIAGGKRNPAYRGLGPSGPAVIDACNRLGMPVDMAHTGEHSFDAVLAHSKAPVFVSHGNARALADHHRNLSDEQLKALAEQGGVIGVMFFPWLISLGIQRLRDDYRRVVDHIDHISALVGPEHVAFGSDFDGMIWTVRGLNDVAQLPTLTCELVERGYDDDAIRGILGGNWLRYWRSVTAASKALG